ncbi:MAG TPA: alpha/beta hydrolase [Leptospiraceae bacterium]|nr:alpha/beta hydrolase [Leptospiraceae bacterium]HMW07076.1 alpha/beta hydrolase [Leptospiraceae bacterium]HMX34483.1 alpha/beta hydrolase [Leptospiraceae bacterium]HMY33749.1 alpha/beta hydrolase [Leptospiraceae bacterium]HMZ66885.1 alpha/beta hydrolase [Leptospiraceae bacterium]
MNLVYRSFYKYFSYTRYQILKKELGLVESYEDIGGNEVCYFVSQNTGKPLILIHGLLDSAFGFRKLVPYLDKQYKLYIIDIPGFGKSRLPKIKYLYQIDIFAKMIYRVIENLNLENAILCGHSMGGLISQHIALLDLHKKRISKLFLLSSGGIPHPKRDEMRAILFPSEHEEVTRLLQHLYYREAPAPSKIIRKTLVVAWNSIEYQYLAENTIEREHEIFFGKEARKIKIPTIIISGKQDSITSPESMKILKSYIRGSKLILLDHARHAIHLEKPREIAEILNNSH